MSVLFLRKGVGKSRSEVHVYSAYLPPGAGGTARSDDVEVAVEATTTDHLVEAWRLPGPHVSLL